MRKPLVFLNEGRYRRVYLSRTGKYVIKIPINHVGEADNGSEDFSYHFSANNENLARCKAFFYNNQLCLIMEKVEIIDWSKNSTVVPEWVSYVDCRQVGYNRDGKLVAYDWAVNK